MQVPKLDCNSSVHERVASASSIDNVLVHQAFVEPQTPDSGPVIPRRDVLRLDLQLHDVHPPRALPRQTPRSSRLHCCRIA
jgi:hypothetical protein